MVFAFGDFELDEERFELRSGGSKVPVQPKVLEFLVYLVKRRTRLVPRHDLMQDLWPGVTVSEAALARVIMEARKAIGDELQQSLVTVRGRGFRFVAPVTEHERA